MNILIDNGHGQETPGKRSPDGLLLEYAWARACARKVVDDLKARGVDAHLLVPEEEDVSLKERVKRVNDVCDVDGKSNVLLVSIHNNAAGNGDWRKARGWSVYVDSIASQASKTLAIFLARAAAKHGQTVRRPGHDTPYWTQNLYILKHTKCPAVLTENLFMDNHEDCEYLLTEEGMQKLVEVHVDGIVNYVKSLE